MSVNLFTERKHLNSKHQNVMGQKEPLQKTQNSNVLVLTIEQSLPNKVFSTLTVTTALPIISYSILITRLKTNLSVNLH